MHFQFHATMNDADYLAFNQFWMIRSDYGRAQIAKMRGTLALIAAILGVAMWMFGGFALAGLWGLIPLGVVLAILELTFPRFLAFSIKGQIQSLKKSGKLAYSPKGRMEFYDDLFVEITPENKTEIRYTAIESVSVIPQKAIYIHLDTVRAHILTYQAFASREQYDEFVAFLKTKTANVRVYEP